MSRYLISPEQFFTTEEEHYLEVSEVFYDTIQGEGITAGTPAVFLRLRGCTLNCHWCDSKPLWQKNGSKIGIKALYRILKQESNLFDRLRRGTTHLVITGGSPLLQQYNLCKFLKLFSQDGSRPFVEIENETVISPMEYLRHRVNLWNNSPKLVNSGMVFSAGTIDTATKQMVALREKSTFKFVVQSYLDIQEIREWMEKYNPFPGQVLIMPEGKTKEELSLTQTAAIDVAKELGVRFAHRLHILLWDDKKGV